MTFYRFTSTQTKKRENVCSLCEYSEASSVGKVDYFGLGTYDMVQCPLCGLISIDPIPSADIVEKGCTLLYASQMGSESKEKTLRGFGRSYRRGISFAKKYLRPLFSQEGLQILEIGAGDGYFPQGIQKVYPLSHVTYVDVVEDLIHFYKKHHGGTSVQGEFKPELFPKTAFDLILCRDLLEHTRNPVQFLKDCAQVLKPGGAIFFITPNGKEDFWTLHQKHLHSPKPALMLLNHFHYFLPETLDKMLTVAGLKKSMAFKFGLKQHRKGLGVNPITHFEEATLPVVKNLETRLLDFWSHDPKKVKETFLNRGNWISGIYSALVDIEKEKTEFSSPEGHEFFVIATKET